MRQNESFESMDHEDSIPSYLSRLTQVPLLTHAEEIELTSLAQQGDQNAKKRVVEANMRLVINIARAYRSRTVSLEDLIQEGAIGLMHAVDRYDASKGFRFSTYATHWVRQSIGRALDNKAKAIRLPAHITHTLRRMEKERGRLIHTLGREPSFKELADSVDVTEARLKSMIQSSQELVSLDMKVGERDSTTLGSLIRDDSAGDPESRVLDAEVSDELRNVLNELSDRERVVMTARLKIEVGSENAMRDELAEELQISRERIRQIEIQAIKKLRVIAHRRQLKEYLSF